MHSAVHQSHPAAAGNARARWTPLVFAGGLLLAFFAAPWSLEHKAHAALHGLCAQTPSHTFLVGGTPLPFDARMTGIYGGFATAFVCLVLLGRHRAARLPSIPMMVLLAVLIGAMAVDGFNSLFRDLGRQHLYQPDNQLRLLTGIGTGLTLAVILCYLFAVTMWRRPNTSQRVIVLRDIAVLIPSQIPFVLLVVSGWGWLAEPLTVGLVIAALGVLSALGIIAIVLLKRLDYSFDNAADLHAHATSAMLLAVIVMAALASGRFLLEHVTGIQTMP